ncbi:Hypothetical_protein [Hexamita inflata]|uniref:Hypothetical_protein n=1 Tax=Hexamita inflata TaxID=28002 RepID=A0AA86RH70_9EUKA|nr:Hypothetical protein HINF_LOCUS64122 [Hexamita inflata]
MFAECNFDLGYFLGNAQIRDLSTYDTRENYLLLSAQYLRDQLIKLVNQNIQNQKQNKTLYDQQKAQIKQLQLILDDYTTNMRIKQEHLQSNISETQSKLDIFNVQNSELEQTFSTLKSNTDAQIYYLQNQIQQINSQFSENQHQMNLKHVQEENAQISIIQNQLEQINTIEKDINGQKSEIQKLLIMNELNEQAHNKMVRDLEMQIIITNQQTMLNARRVLDNKSAFDSIYLVKLKVERLKIKGFAQEVLKRKQEIILRDDRIRYEFQKKQIADLMKLKSAKELTQKSHTDTRNALEAEITQLKDQCTELETTIDSFKRELPENSFQKLKKIFQNRQVTIENLYKKPLENPAAAAQKPVWNLPKVYEVKQTSNKPTFALKVIDAKFKTDKDVTKSCCEKKFQNKSKFALSGNEFVQLVNIQRPKSGK